MNKPTCFVIMPYSVRLEDLDTYSRDTNHWREVYHGLIVPALEAAGFTFQLDSDDHRSRVITDQIWQKIEDADLILCDLSSENPNVFLELGWALRADKKFVLISDDVTPPNFDVKQHFTFTYSHRLQPTKLQQDVEKLASIIRETIRDSGQSSSIVRRLNVKVSAIEAVNEGNLEVGLLQEILGELRGETVGIRDSMVPVRGRPKVMIFWHSTGITRDNASHMVTHLADAGIEGIVARHVNPSPSDSIYIRDTTHPELVRLVLDMMPNSPTYIFPYDYPDAECGYLSDFAMSVGLHSEHRKGIRPEGEEPIKIGQEQLDILKQSRVSLADYRRRIREIAYSRRT